MGTRNRGRKLTGPQSSQLILVSISRAALRESLGTLCQRRHLPEPVSGPRHLSVRCLMGWESGKREEEEGRRRGDRRPTSASDVSLPPPRCAPGFLGETCQFPDPCRSAQLCQNGGSCQALLPVPLGSSLTPSFLCTCPSGFTGERCQAQLHDPCSAFCSKMGRCHIQASGLPRCSCLPGWTGERRWQRAGEQGLGGEEAVAVGDAFTRDWHSPHGCAGCPGLTYFQSSL